MRSAPRPRPRRAAPGPGGRDDLPGRPGALGPGLAELARVVDRLLPADAVVDALADAMAIPPPGEVALRVAPAGAAVAGIGSDERGHDRVPPGGSARRR